MFVTLICGNASDWIGPRPDLVFTHPYAPLPKSVHGVPAIINLYEGKQWRQPTAERWLGAGTILQKIGSWGRGGHNTVYVAGLARHAVEIADLVEDEFLPGRGWMPLELPLRLLDRYSYSLKPGALIWDGFCGRGTIGRAAVMRGYSYIGIDRDPARVEIAKDYLGC